MKSTYSTTPSKEIVKCSTGDPEIFNGGYYLDENSKHSMGTLKKRGRKVGRNEICPCESGKKYKNCCITNII